jgi:hypothetical protein
VASGFQSSLSALLFPVFDLFGKEIEAQRAGSLIKIDILAFNLIALHKQIAFKFTAEGRFIL